MRRAQKVTARYGIIAEVVVFIRSLVDDVVTVQLIELFTLNQSIYENVHTLTQ